MNDGPIRIARQLRSVPSLTWPRYRSMTSLTVRYGGLDTGPPCDGSLCNGLLHKRAGAASLEKGEMAGRRSRICNCSERPEPMPKRALLTCLWVAGFAPNTVVRQSRAETRDELNGVSPLRSVLEIVLSHRRQKMRRGAQLAKTALAHRSGMYARIAPIHSAVAGLRSSRILKRLTSAPTVSRKPPYSSSE